MTTTARHQELEYRLSVHNQRTCARNLQEWYETKLQPLMESHHSALENTKTTMINTINAIIDCASTCSRIYSHGLDKASSLLPLRHRALIQEKMDLEAASRALVPVDYYNSFFNVGKPSPLHFGISVLPLNFSTQIIQFISRVPAVSLLEAEQTNELGRMDSDYITLFELAQYGPLLPLNSQEFERVKFSKSISRRSLVALMAPDKSVWEPFGSVARKGLIKMAIGNVLPEWLTFRKNSDFIVDAMGRKWDFETDKPMPN